MRIEPDGRHDVVLVAGGAGVGVTLHIEGLGPQQFIVTRAALVQRFGAGSSETDLLDAFHRGIADIEIAAAMGVNGCSAWSTTPGHH